MVSEVEVQTRENLDEGHSLTHVLHKTLGPVKTGHSLRRFFVKQDTERNSTDPERARCDDKLREGRKDERKVSTI